MLYKTMVLGVGHYLPKKILKNSELPQHLNTCDTWIQERTGIEQRHIADETETTAYMAYMAAQEVLSHHNMTGADVEAVIVATTSPDHGFPAVATRVQAMLGNTKGFGFDVQAVCSGFVYALSVADSMIKSGQISSALVIGAETMSRIVDWKDRSTCVLFGDGAGAVLLKRSVETDSPHPERGILSTHLYSDGSGYDLLFIDHSIETEAKRGAVCMNGREIFKNAVQKIGQAVEQALAFNSLTIEDIDCFVPHQANSRIIKGVVDMFKLPPHKVVMTVAQHANTSAASIPLAMYQAQKEGRIRQNDLVLIEAMGGGLTWGSALIRW